MARRTAWDIRWVCVGALLWSAAPVRAGALVSADEPAALPYRQLSDPERSPVEDILPPPVPVRFALQLQASLLKPADEAMQLVYGDRLLRFGANFGYYVSSSLMASAGVGYVRQAGEAVGKHSQTLSGEPAELLLIPVELGATWRFPQLSKMLIPFVTAGIDLYNYREEVGERRLSGGKWGWHARGGIAVRVDSAAPSWTSDAGKGIQATSIVIEGGYSGIDDFGGEGLDLSGMVLSAGVGLEF